MLIYFVTHMDAPSKNMLAIIEQTDEMHSCQLDNTTQFLMLMLLKVFLDGAALYLCCFKPLISFLNMCSMSIVIVDLILTIFMAATLWLETHMSHVALCFTMAHFSAAFSALPLPMLCLGILDYCLEDTCAGKRVFKFFRNIILTVLLLALSGIYAITTVEGTLVEQDRNIRYLVCEIQESRIVTYSVVTLSMVLFFTLLPYLLLIPQWIQEADRISEAREEIPDTQTSDLMLSLETDSQCIKDTYKKQSMQRPNMHISVTLGFAVFWMPYLAVTTACVVFDFGVPAYISVNLLWVQCMNSVLVGTLFWLRSNTMGPYNSLPDNVCLWQVYWHLSTGTKAQQVPVAVFNPSKGKRIALFYV